MQICGWIQICLLGWGSTVSEQVTWASSCNVRCTVLVWPIVPLWLHPCLHAMHCNIVLLCPGVSQMNRHSHTPPFWNDISLYSKKCFSDRNPQPIMAHFWKSSFSSGYFKISLQFPIPNIFEMRTYPREILVIVNMQTLLYICWEWQWPGL